MLISEKLTEKFLNIIGIESRNYNPILAYNFGHNTLESWGLIRECFHLVSSFVLYWKKRYAYSNKEPGSEVARIFHSSE